jgi:hypothetical protein
MRGAASGAPGPSPRPAASGTPQAQALAVSAATATADCGGAVGMFSFFNTLQFHPAVVLYVLLYAKSTIPNTQLHDLDARRTPEGVFVICTWRRPTLGEQGITASHFRPFLSRVTASRSHSHGPSLTCPHFFCSRRMGFAGLEG